MFAIELWTCALEAHETERAAELYTILTPEMRLVADNIQAHFSN